ncbi:MAG: nucleotide exchange factor GrpE [Solirubrobacterales bacterium]|nr:nucleotide exchange factor GrpE [Solirubrobacterales bacterium]
MPEDPKTEHVQAPPGGAAPPVADEVEAQAVQAPEAEPASEADLVEEVEATPEAEAAEEDQDELRERAARAQEYLALAQRTQADFENFRKRMTREVAAAEARGMGRLAKELLPALDNLERALAAAEAVEQEHHLTEGIRLVQIELSAALHRAGIEGYHPEGERFDPAHHEAIAQQPVEGTEPGTIVEVLQSGYRLNDAILRPARVIVAG